MSDLEALHRVVTCTQARISYNTNKSLDNAMIVVTCTQARISYNDWIYKGKPCEVVTCTQARISYNQKATIHIVRLL